MIIDYTQVVDSRRHFEVGIQLLDLAKAEAEAEERIMYNLPG